MTKKPRSKQLLTVIPFTGFCESRHSRLLDEAKACAFFDVPEDTYENMPEEDQEALIARYKEATYRCPATLNMQLTKAI